MKSIIVYLLMIIPASALYGQSSIVFDSGTSVYVGTGADLCAATVTINGTHSGGGTFCNTPVAVDNGSSPDKPKQFALLQNYPNPFNPGTIINYELPVSGHVILKIYDIIGDEIATLVNEEEPAGSYEVEFNTHSGGMHNLPSGIYIYQLKAGPYLETRKMMLMK
jgi:hypothetical protein